jgi:CHAT domain-containing protein
MVQGEPMLWLEQGDGSAARVTGGELAARLQELQQRPRLIVLASCQSAGSGDGGEALSVDGRPLAALGPRLAEAGVPAVLAMQGQISMEIVAAFMPSFFAELQRDG